MRWLWIVVVCALGCGTSEEPGDAGDAGGEAAACTGAAFECCSGCGDDTPNESVCVNGQMQCPGGTVPQSSLHCPCFAFACSLPPPHPHCTTCDGGSPQSACNEDAGEFECPAGSFDVDDLDAAAACD